MSPKNQTIEKDSLLELTPNGFVICRDLKIFPEFSESDAAGIIALSGKKNIADFNDPALHFWRDFSAHS